MCNLDGPKLEDPFLSQYQPSELSTAAEFLTAWLPFLSRDLCHNCTDKLSQRISSLALGAESGVEAEASNSDTSSTPHATNMEEVVDNYDANMVASSIEGSDTPVETSAPRVLWADMSQDNEHQGEEDEEQEQLEATKRGSSNVVKKKPKLSRDQRERIRFLNVKRKKDYVCFERVNGKSVNILQGLELHTGIFSGVEQKRIVDFVYKLKEMGEKGELKERTFTAPQKWMRGKGRITIQFGCCYNYAVDKMGNPPGILRYGAVDPIPDLFKVMIKRLVKWHVIPPDCVPDSCIVNIYEEGDCIPPHIDNHDFVRPFCTVSFLSECNIVFGSSLKIVGPGEFSGSTAIPLPVGSVLVLNGNGADVAKHCVPDRKSVV